MSKLYFLILYAILIFSCAPPAKKIAKEKTDTLLVKELPTKVETVYVTKVETLVETVTVIKEMPIGEVFKIQIGAFKNKYYADRIYNSLKNVYGDLIYVENIPPYWKVRIGYYTNKDEAIKARDKLKRQGFVNAFITKGASSIVSKEKTQSGAYKIQICAFTDKDYADRAYNSLKSIFGDLIYLENINNHWKLRVGHYMNKTDAVNKLQELKKQGFVDAFIVK